MQAQRHIDRYDALYRSFRWVVPQHFNIAEACARRWADDPSRIAMQWESESGERATLSYAELVSRANRLSDALQAMGVARGDRVAVILPQRPETAIAHMAIFQMGAICVPLTVLFGPDAIEYRLANSGAKIAIVDASVAASVQSVRDRLPTLGAVFVVGQSPASGLDKVSSKTKHATFSWHAALVQSGDRFELTTTAATDPALIIYTSGTTGPPKGALMPHSVVLGNIPGFQYSHDGFPQASDVFHSPADWAWTGGLMDALYPCLYFGKTIVAYQGRFDPERSFELMARHGVTCTFLFPTALKMMMKAFSHPRERFDLKLRSIMSGGEAVGTAVYEWAERELSIRINEIFGQTEMNYIVGNSATLWPAKPGSMGRPYPGHRIALIGDDGQPVKAGEVGDVAVHRTWQSDTDAGTQDPVFFIEYWNNPEATAAKYAGDWCKTGDLARMDEDGYLWYEGRADDVFKAAGYRIGPSEIENCLVKHPAVANAAVVPKPDAERGNVIKAYVVLAVGYVASDVLAEQLQQHVKQFLAPYQYPKEIAFIDTLPMTTTGKVQRKVLRERDAQPAA